MKLVKNVSVLQGAGSTSAARSVGRAAERFVVHAEFPRVARAGALQVASEAEALRAAEAKGLAKARR